MAKVNITNLGAHPLSLDFTVEHQTVRATIPTNGTVDVGDRMTLDEVNQSPIIQSLKAAGKISVAAVVEASDILADVPDKAFVAADLNLMTSAFMGTPALAATNGLMTVVDWADGTKSIAAQPDCPRNVTAALTDGNNSITGGSLTITGQDVFGRTITEVMHPDGLGGGKTLTGTKPFAKVTSIVIAGTTGVPAAGVDTFICGYGNVIGLPTDIKAVGAVKHVWFNNARVASPTVTAGVSISGIDASAGTYNGSKPLVALYQLGE